MNARSKAPSASCRRAAAARGRAIARWAAVFLLVLGGCAHQPPRAPALTAASSWRVDYSTPERYLAMDEHFATAKQLRAVAAPLKRKRVEETLAAIWRWIAQNLRNDPKAAYRWRKLDEMLAAKSYGSCADHALLFGSLAQANGIPTLWVKTMNAEWIREFRRKKGMVDTWRGHVFLEQHVKGRWVLVDATAGKIYEDYSPSARLLPGGRWAYDKGGRPYELILSLRWEAWLAQTKRVFADFDLAKLPVEGGRTLGGRREAPAGGAGPCGGGGVSVVSISPPALRALDAKLRALGRRVCLSFDHRFTKWMPRARGGVLIVTMVGARIALPEKYHAAILPRSVADMQKAMARSGHGQLERRLQDGTRVVLLFGRDEASLNRAVEALSLRPEGGKAGR